MNKKIVAGLTILLMLLLTVISGCDGESKPKPAQSQQNKDELIVAICNEPEDGFDPVMGWGRYGSPLFQSTLLKRDKDLNIVSDLAATYEVSKDSLVWTVKIRDDVKFSDGTPLTAEDVAFTFTTAANSGSVVDLTNLKSAVATDKSTVAFTLIKPQSTFVNLLISTGIVPKHAYNEQYSQAPIGSGPFQFVQWDKGQQLIVEVNPEYYGPKPYFKKLTFLFLGEDAAYAAAKSGNVDITTIPPALGKHQVAGMKLVAVPSVDNRGIMFPVGKAGEKTADGKPIGNDVTADIAIRKAINIAIDRQALVDGVLEGFGTPAYTVCDGLPWWNPDTVINDNDMEEAKKILAEGGWQDQDGDGILEKDNLKAEFNLIYPSSDQTRQSLAIAVADKIKELGIKINAQGKSWDEIGQMVHSNAVLFGWGSHTPLEMYNLYSTSTRGFEWYNSGFYSNPKVDEYMEKAQLALSEEEAIGYWKKAQWDGQTGLAYQGDAPWAWLVNLKHLYLVNDKLDIGTPKIEPHGHGWPITDNIAEWRWQS